MGDTLLYLFGLSHGDEQGKANLAPQSKILPHTPRTRCLAPHILRALLTPPTWLISFSSPRTPPLPPPLRPLPTNTKVNLAKQGHCFVTTAFLQSVSRPKMQTGSKSFVSVLTGAGPPTEPDKRIKLVGCSKHMVCKYCKTNITFGFYVLYCSTSHLAPR